MYSSVWDEIGDVLHTPMCSYTLTLCLCILSSLCVRITVIGCALLYRDGLSYIPRLE